MPTNSRAPVDNKNNNALLCQAAVCAVVCVFVSVLLICFAWLVKFKGFVIVLAVCVRVCVRGLNVSENEAKRAAEWTQSFL